MSSSTTAAAFALQQQHLLPMPAQPPAVQPLDTSALLLRAHQDAEVKLNGRASKGTLPPQRRAWQGLQAPLAQQPPFTVYARHVPPSSAWQQRAAATEPLCFAAEPISQTLDGLLTMPLHRSNGEQDIKTSTVPQYAQTSAEEKQCICCRTTNLAMV